MGGTGAKALIRVGVLATLARLLGPDEFGIMAAALLFTAFVQIVVRGGIGPVLVQLPQLTDAHVRTAFFINALFGLVLFVALWSFAAPISGTVFDMAALPEVLRAACWMVPFRTFSVIPEVLLQRDMKFKVLARAEVQAYAIGYGVVSISAALSGLGVWSLVLGHVGESIVKLILLLRARRHPVGWPEREALRVIAVLGGGFTLARFANFGALNGDTWAVGRILGETALGFYKYAYELAMLPGQLLGDVLDRVMFPALAKAQGDRDRLARAYRACLSLTLMLVGPISILMIVLADPIIRLFLGPQWLPVVVPFQILALVSVFRAGLKLSDSLARATGSVYRRSWRQGAYAVAVIGGAMFGSRFDLVGAAGGVALAVLFSFTLMLQLALSLMSLRFRNVIAVFARAVPLTLVTLCVALVLQNLLTPAGLSVFVFLAATTAGALAILLLSLWAWPGLMLGVDGRRALRLVVPALGSRAAGLTEHPAARRILGTDLTEDNTS
jgi:PST family polysaccharide transporter